MLDYGCGDGALFHELDRYVPLSNLCGFDPYFLHEMDRRGSIPTYDHGVTLVAERAASFDKIYCIEVCEHLTAEPLAELFANLKRLGKAGAVYLFGVPLETGLPGLAKNLYRLAKGGRQGATWGKVAASFLGLPIARESESPGWIGSHIGFDSNVFAERLAAEGFEIVSRSYLPWPKLGAAINNEVYFTCRLVRAIAPAMSAPLRMAA